jgi:hypothetical protein
MHKDKHNMLYKKIVIFCQKVIMALTVLDEGELGGRLVLGEVHVHPEHHAALR